MIFQSASTLPLLYFHEEFSLIGSYRVIVCCSSCKAVMYVFKTTTSLEEMISMKEPALHELPNESRK